MKRLTKKNKDKLKQSGTGTTNGQTTQTCIWHGVLINFVMIHCWHLSVYGLCSDGLVLVCGWVLFLKNTNGAVPHHVKTDLCTKFVACQFSAGLVSVRHKSTWVNRAPNGNQDNFWHNSDTVQQLFRVKQTGKRRFAQVQSLYQRG